MRTLMSISFPNKSNSNAPDEVISVARVLDCFKSATCMRNSVNNIGCAFDYKSLNLLLLIKNNIFYVIAAQSTYKNYSSNNKR